jgi:prolyl-tRNA editing enzyme YbaK/EbsC (Cys-tRNA(Pro) deacylase)
MNEELSEGIKLVRGNPTAEELAAAIAVVEAMLDEEQAAAATGRQQAKSTWNRSSVNLRGGITPGFGQWKASFRDGLN